MFYKSETNTFRKWVRRLSPSQNGSPAAWTAGFWLCLAFTILPSAAHASMFKGEQLDNLAEILAWVVLVVGPIAGIVIFLLIHILPEKIAERNGHPQASAIKTLCLLSLVFGGMLWPLAWLLAYTKPVLYKMAYGTDVASEHGAGTHEAKSREAEPSKEARATAAMDLESLLRRIEELEATVAKSRTEGGKA